MAGRREYRAGRRLKSEACESGGSAQTVTPAAGEPWDWVSPPVDVQAGGSDHGGVRRAGRWWLWVACCDQRGKPEPGTSKTALALGSVGHFVVLALPGDLPRLVTPIPDSGPGNPP